MSEPHGPRRPVPAHGADVAIATGRRRARRRRAAAATTGVAVALTGVVALTAGGGAGGPSGLRPAGTGPLPTELPTVPATPLPTSLPTPTGTPPPPPEETPEPTGTARPTGPATRPTGSADGRWIGHSRGGQTFRRGEPEPAACPAAPAAPANGYCTFALGPRTVSPGEVVRLTLKLCRATSAPGSVVRYPDVDAVRIWVAAHDDATGGEDEVWRWRNDSDPNPFTQPYDPGECDTWSIPWRGQDAEGYALRPGDYQVNAAVPDADWGTAPPPPAYYTVTVR